MNNNVYWSFFEDEDWRFFLAATSKGLCYVGSPNAPFANLQTWAKRRFFDRELIEDHTVLKPYKAELSEYFKGSRKSFTFPVDIHGTAFQQEVWNTLNQIPYGQTYTYSQIAEMVKRPAAVRAVGTAIGANPVLITVPCHRVIGKDGKLTGYRGGLEMKQFLLNLEGNK
ncbi:methylated-DNA--[protein]-cysteine S-methyltransferase [Neobacillus pocheonensis]|uniref:methylated-DNA--[protein]-cysteine S-methyltransferase n=1 Tax=Neobacillus pocheonensis TaxID=363869 RepID=UPI003D28B58F